MDDGGMLKFSPDLGKIGAKNLYNHFFDILNIFRDMTILYAYLYKILPDFKQNIKSIKKCWTN